MSKELLQKNIKEFQETFGFEVPKGSNYTPEIVLFFIQSHISMIEEEIKELKERHKQYSGKTNDKSVQAGYLLAIQDLISHKEKELSEYKEPTNK